MKKLIKSLLVMGTLMAVTSCAAPKDFSYFQDVAAGESLTLPPAKLTKICPQDQLYIVVETRNPELRMAYNKTLASDFTPEKLMNVDYMIAYTVDEDGNVNFPHVGKIQVGGKTRREAELYIETLLKSQNLVNDASVTVQLQSQTYNVLGEVGHPGRFAITKDDFTIFDAIGSCSDLTTMGKRNNIKVLRTEDGKQKVYEIDLTSAKSVLASPVFYIQKGDVIYVEPNKTKALQSTTNSNQTFTYSFWISLASTLLTLGVLLFK